MQGVYCTGDGIRFRDDLPRPTPAPGEVRLGVRLAGICETDVQIARGYMEFRGVLGHEFVGVDGQGRRFTAEINNACHSCEACRQGRSNHCPNRTVLGILKHDGAMAEEVCVPEVNLHAIPDGIDDRHAVMVEPLAAAYRVLEQVTVRPSDRVAILGDGKLGLLCTWVLRTTGAAVHLIGKHPEKLALAGDGVTTHPLDEARDLAHGFDLVIDATGSTTGLPTALGLVRPTGTVVLKTTVADPSPYQLAPAVIDEVRIVGSRCGPFPAAIRALADGVIDVEPLIEATFPLAEAEAAFATATTPGARKILLQIA